MEFIKRSMNKILNIIPGRFFGILSVSLALAGIFISLFSFPGYNLLLYDVSYLATSPLGTFFNLGLILSGIIAIPFHFHMNLVVAEGNIKPKLKNVALSLSLMSSITLSLIGFFPVLTDSALVLLIHGMLALLTFCGITVYCLLYGVFFLKLPDVSIFQSIFSFLVSGIFVFYFTNRWSLVEWIGVGSIMAWIVMNAIPTSTNKRNITN